MAIGSRVRFLGEKIGAEAAEIYRSYGTNLHPKWFPVFYVLSQRAQNSVTSVAEEIGHSHASVSKILKEMAKAGLIVEKADAKDGRRTFVGLSARGKETAKKIEAQYLDVSQALEEISKEATHSLWEALIEWEYLLEQKSLHARVLEKKKARESSAVKIVPYQPKFQKAFRALNEEWITTHFKMEQPDFDALDHPKKYILDKGGFIFVALWENQPVGVCALIKKEFGYELAKMAVSPHARGKNIGYLLGKAVLEKAREQKAKKVFLESNTVLKPAINLYKKLGFKKIVGPPTPYERCNIQMEVLLR